MSGGYDEDITIPKQHLPLLLRQRVIAVVEEALSDERVAAMLGPDGQGREHTMNVELPDGQTITITLDIDVWSLEAEAGD